MKKKGFTLIELLVVVAIIAILASVVLASLSNGRARAKDAKRLSDKKQVVNALNLYYTYNNAWPSTGGTWNCLAPTAENCLGGPYSGLDSLVTAIKPYMATLPTTDAKPTSSAYNRILYTSFQAADAVIAGSLPGAYLLWFMEGTITPSMCPSVRLPSQFPPPDNYWYCYEYLGPR